MFIYLYHKMTMKKLDPLKLEKVAIILKVAANPIRLGIIDVLDKKGSLSVNDICNELKSDQSLTSHHLKNMRLNGILSTKRYGKQIFYSLKLKEVVEIIKCLEKCNRL